MVTWGRKNVSTFLKEYGISEDGLQIFYQLGVVDGKTLLQVDMSILDKVGRMGKTGQSDLLRKVDKERLLNGIRGVRENTTHKDTTLCGPATPDHLPPSIPPLSLTGMSPPKATLRYAGATPRATPLSLTLAAHATTPPAGTATLHAPLAGSYIVRCTAVGYFSCTSQVFTSTQPRSHSSTAPGFNITVRMNPKLRKVAIALVDFTAEHTSVSRSGAAKYAGIPIKLTHVDTGCRHAVVCDKLGVCRMALPPGNYLVSVDMQVVVIPEPGEGAGGRANVVSRNATLRGKGSHVASSDVRSEVFVRCDGDVAVAKYKQFIVLAGLRVANVIQRKVTVIRERKKKAMIVLQCVIRARGIR